VDPEYATGAIKYDPATKAVAIRTMLPDDEKYGHQAWLAAYTDALGAQFRTSDFVANWVDVPVPIIIDGTGG
jgi:hypothetical protein